MATLTPTLTLVSTDATSDALSLSVTDSLTIGAPIESISRISAPATTSVVEIVPTGSGNQYVYIKHTGFQGDGSTASTQQLAIKTGSTADQLRLSAGEFCFFTSKSDVTISVGSSGNATILVEYAYFTQA